MKYIFSPTLLALLSSQASAQGSLTALEAKNGFRDVKLRTSARKYSRMYLIKDNKDFNDLHYKIYRRKSGRLKLDIVPLTSIEYLVKDEKIYRIQIFVLRAEDIIRVEHILWFAYGLPTQSYPHQSNWEGNKVIMFYTQSKNYQDIPMRILEIYSAPLSYKDSAKEKRSNINRIKQATSDL